MNKLIIFILIGCMMTSVYAQNNDASLEDFDDFKTEQRVRYHSLMFGVGGLSQLDSYLSSLENKGTAFTFYNENERVARKFEGKLNLQNVFQGDFAYCHSPSKETNTMYGNVSWRLAWLYNVYKTSALIINVGPSSDLQGGFVYAMSNGNNPTQMRLSLDVCAAAQAVWRLPINKYDIRLKYQVQIPFSGVMFSPNYGQSYYEIFSLGNYDHNVCYTNPFQAFNMHQMLSAEWALKSFSLRMAYYCQIHQSHVNNIKVHDYTNSFMIGYVKRFTLLKK